MHTDVTLKVIQQQAVLDPEEHSELCCECAQTNTNAIDQDGYIRALCCTTDVAIPVRTEDVGHPELSSSALHCIVVVVKRERLMFPLPPQPQYT